MWNCRVTLADQHVPVRESSGLLDQAIEGLLGVWLASSTCFHKM